MTQYHFNGVSLDSATRRIQGPHGSVHLPPKPYGVLVELLHAHDRVVTREILLDRVWPERPASDEALSRTVADLRKLLGEDARSRRYIETVPKIGYRFVPPVEASERRAPPQQRRRALIAAVAVLAVAVGVGFVVSRPAIDTRNAIGGGILAPTLPLTTEIGDEDTPDFSPDGRYLVYAAREGGDENWDLRLREVASGETWNLVTGPDREYAPAFSPDGRRVAFLRYRGEDCRVLVKALDGGERPVANCRTPMMAYLDWSPDGRHIVYSDTPQQGSATLELRQVDLETGTSAAVVAAAPEHQYQFAPRFSPDGRRLVYVQGGLELNELWLAELSDARASPITALGGRITGVSWNGDGTALYFGTAPPAEPALWRLVPGEAPVRIRDGEAYTPAFDAVNRRLVFDNVRARTNVWSLQMGADGAQGEPVRRIASTRADSRPSVSPDGARLVFVSDRSGHAEIWLAGADGGGQRRLTDWQAAAISRPDWSPDGRTLVYAVLRDGRWVGYVDPMDGTVRHRIPSAGRELRNPVWSRDGHWILFAADEGIRRLATTDWREEAVLDQPGAVPLFHHEGVLYFLHPGLPGIQRRGRDGLQQTLLADFDLVVPEAISVSNRHLYFIGSEPQDGSRRLFAYDLASASVRSILPLVAYTRHAHTAVTPDGSTVYFSQTADVESDLVVLEALR